MKGPALGITVLLLALTSCIVAGPAEGQPALVQRGKYLVVAGDCTACHTSPGGAFLAGGVPLQTPFGVLVPPNITPDKTGIGGWTDAQFDRAMQHGRAPGWKHLYPGFPYIYYTKVSKSDLTAIHAYLNSVYPVANAVVANRLPFPYNIRALMIGWNVLFFSPGRYKPNPAQTAQWNRGAYLVEGRGHCGACHTAKNFLGGDQTSHYLQGGLLAGWYAPSLNNAPRTGLGSWSVQDIVDYLGTGRNEKDGAVGPMAEVVMDSTSHLTRADLTAIAVYLKSQPAPAMPAPVPLAAADPAMRAGAEIYQDNCSVCHTASGLGVATLFPALAGSAVVQSAEPATLIRVVLQGVKSSTTVQAPTGLAMPTFGWKLSDTKIAEVLTYIRNSWGNAAPAVPQDKVTKARDALVHSKIGPA